MYFPDNILWNEAWYTHIAMDAHVPMLFYLQIGDNFHMIKWIIGLKILCLLIVNVGWKYLCKENLAHVLYLKFLHLDTENLEFKKLPSENYHSTRVEAYQKFIRPSGSWALARVTRYVCYTDFACHLFITW